MKARFTALILIALLILPVASIANAQDDDTLRIGYLPILVMEQFFVADQQGWFDELGVTTESIRFSSGAPVVQAFAAGELDVAYVGINPALVMASRGLPIKVVAANAHDALSLIANDTLATLWEEYGDGQALTQFVEQEGRLLRVVTLPEGTTPNTVLRLWVASLGLEIDDVVEIIPLGVQQVQAALATGEADASLIMEPVISFAQQQEWGFELIVPGSKILENQPGAVLVVSDALIAENPELVQSIVDLHIEATILANEDKELAAQAASDFIGEEVLPLDIALIAVEAGNLNWIANPYNILESTQVYNEFQVDLEVFDEAVAQEDLFDLSFFDAAIEANPELEALVSVVSEESEEE